MARAKRGSTRAAPRRKTSRTTVRRRAPARRQSFAAAPRRRATGTRRSAGGGQRTVRIEVVQAAAPALSPITQMLLDSRRVIMPKKARF